MAFKDSCLYVFVVAFFKRNKRQRLPQRVSSGGKGVAAVTSATRVRFVLGGTIYIAWVPGKEELLSSNLFVACWKVTYVSRFLKTLDDKGLI
ncbi:hypothetical protein YC2023_001627 [Brassica napus]